MNNKENKNYKTAFITGIAGQDGSYLAEFLVGKGYQIFGLVRDTSPEKNPNIKDLITAGKIALIQGDMTDRDSITCAFEQVTRECQEIKDDKTGSSRPIDEVYNLAAQTDYMTSFAKPGETFDLNYQGVGYVVDAAMKCNPVVRIFQASSSEMFGEALPPQSEMTPFKPISPYGEAKLKAHNEFVVGYREKYGLYICSGILFNHESPRRQERYVTRKITSSLARIKLGLQEVLELGNIDARRDWGFSGDYVRAMWSILQESKPDDYVIASGVSHTVRDFVNAAASALDMQLTWEGEGIHEVARDTAGAIRVRVNEKFYRPIDTHFTCGDPAKLMTRTGWKPQTTFEELVCMMAKSDLEKAQ
jgi:GDPmannose 4,6-dehydratase